MYNKGSCRICGTFLIATSVCDICTEHISWTCGHCDRTDDITHSHEITAYQSRLEYRFPRHVVARHLFGDSPDRAN